jgi:MFS family permease
MSTSRPAAADRLDPVVRRYLASVAVSRFGTGLTLPFTLILLHEVRGIDLPTVGLLMALPGAVGLAAVPVSGALVDRFGPRAVLRGCLLLQAVGTALLAFGSTPAQVLPALLLNGLGIGPSFPAGNALLTGLLSRPEQAPRAFGVQFTVINAGVGLGGLVAAVVVDLHRAVTFEVLFLACAVACLLQFLMLPPAAPPVHDEDADAPSYREVLSDPVFRRLCGVSLLFAMTGYAALDTGLPAFARVEGDVAPSTIGLVLTVNTVLIVALQLPALRWVQHWRHTRALAVAATIWALSWALLGISQATVVVLLFGAVFGLGEVFLAPAMQPLINGLASDRLRGRYNALSGAMYSVAFVVSPALSGLLIGSGLGWLWISGLVVGSLAAAGMVLRLRRRLTPEQDGLLAAVS